MTFLYCPRVHFFCYFPLLTHFLPVYFSKCSEDGGGISLAPVNSYRLFNIFPCLLLLMVSIYTGLKIACKMLASIDLHTSLITSVILSHFINSLVLDCLIHKTRKLDQMKLKISSQFKHLRCHWPLHPAWHSTEQVQLVETQKESGNNQKASERPCLNLRPITYYL